MKCADKETEEGFLNLPQPGLYHPWLMPCATQESSLHNASLRSASPYPRDSKVNPKRGGSRSLSTETATDNPQIHIASHNRSNRPGMATIHHARPPESSRLNIQK